MEFQRRLGAGRLAEILGAAALPSDRFMRTLGFYRLAEASLAHLEPDTVAWLQAYADGVNAFLQSRTGPLPPEFLILRHGELEPWRPADSLVWLRLMALDLATNYRDELARARLARRLSAEQIADIWPTYPESAPVTLVELARALPWDELAAVLPPDGPGGVGSNAWVVGPGRTTTGGALLANDPHLGLQAPGAWYLAHLETSGLELIGATMAGIPAMVLGHNGTIAWGFTNTGADTQDLFIERVDPEDPNRYLTPEGPAPFEVREELIQIAGAAPVALTVRVTRHGPVISDLLPDAAAFGRDRLVALAWSALTEDDLALQALLAVGKAQNWQQFVAALRDVGAPMQNIHYADTSGHIGFIAPGRVPIRRNGDGRWPVPGWTGEYDWQGWIPFRPRLGRRRGHRRLRQFLRGADGGRRRGFPPPLQRQHPCERHGGRPRESRRDLLCRSDGCRKPDRLSRLQDGTRRHSQPPWHGRVRRILRGEASDRPGGRPLRREAAARSLPRTDAVRGRHRDPGHGRRRPHLLGRGDGREGRPRRRALGSRRCPAAKTA